MFKADDRVRETSATTGTGTYTLDGAPVGFQAFSSLGANNFCPYFATDDTNWEVGIGQVLTGPNRLARTQVLSSSNADAAVNWVGAGPRKIRCGLPAFMAFDRAKSKSVAGGADVTLSQDEQRCSILTLTGALTADISVIMDDTPWTWTIVNSTTGAFTLRAKVAGQPGVELYQGRASKVVNDGGDCKKSGDDPAPGSQIDSRGTVVEDGYYEEDGANVLISTDPALYQKLTRRKSGATVTIAAPGVWTWNSHKLKVNDAVKFATTGALPTGLTAGTTYFVKSPTTNTFEVAATEGGASINTTGSQSGTHTAIHAPHGDGDGATTFTLPDSRRRVNVGRGGTAATAALGLRLGAIGGDERPQQHAHGVTDPTHVHAEQGDPVSEFPPINATINRLPLVAERTDSQANQQPDNGQNTVAAATGISIQNSGAGGSENIQPSIVVTKWVRR